MSTHPRDFSGVIGLAQANPRILPCLGVHPWFLHELTAADWHPLRIQDGKVIPAESRAEKEDAEPKWIRDMEALLVDYQEMPVGEIGLDGFHFDPVTKDLSCPMAVQVKALELQLSLAIRLERPVSLHCVRAMGPMMAALTKAQKEHRGRLPPALYFHAFGGKPGTATQLARTLEKKKATKVYFGFAPIVNFQSPKTKDVILEVGLDRLVLETDHEDAAFVPESMSVGVTVLAEILGVKEGQLISHTNANARALYSLPSKDVLAS